MNLQLFVSNLLSDETHNCCLSKFRHHAVTLNLLRLKIVWVENTINFVILNLLMKALVLSISLRWKMFSAFISVKQKTMKNFHGAFVYF